MSITEDGRAFIDDHSLTYIDIRDPMEVLVKYFPGYSVECLKQSYDGNRNDLISTIAMLKELEDVDSNDLIPTIERYNGIEVQLFKHFFKLTYAFWIAESMFLWIASCAKHVFLALN